MFSYQVQSILYALLALVAGVYSAAVPTAPADESISTPVPVVVKSAESVETESVESKECLNNELE